MDPRFGGPGSLGQPVQNDENRLSTPEESSSRGSSRNNAATGASAAGVRALSAQLVAFYFRAPVKAFFRTRVDYMVRIHKFFCWLNSAPLSQLPESRRIQIIALTTGQAFARAVYPNRSEGGRWSLNTTTPGLLIHAVRTHGWRFIPNQVMPPLLANAGVGAVLYTSYLQVLGALHEPVSQGVRRIYPPAHPADTFTAGLLAGSIQSIVAAPLDALQVRLRINEILEGHYQTMWHYGRNKLRQIGLRGIFAGWSLSFMRDSCGSAVFFSSFEYIKSQSYYSFLTTYYGALQAHQGVYSRSPQSSDRGLPLIEPHYAVEPCFLMAAGVAASVAQQTIQHPLNAVQNIHVSRLEYLDHQATLRPSNRQMLRIYYLAYRETYKRCKRKAARAGGWARWLYRGFLGTALRQVPSTSAGLVIFELVRRRHANMADAMYIRKDGYDVLLR